MSAAGQSENVPSSVIRLPIVVGTHRRGVGDGVFRTAGKTGRETLCVIDQGGEIDRGGRGAAGRRQQRLRDREFDAFAVAGEAGIERRPAVELGSAASGCDRIQIGLKRSVRIQSELHLILGANVAERQLIAGRVILIRIQIDDGTCGDDLVRRGGRVDTDHVRVAERRIVEESAVDLIPYDGIFRRHERVSRQPVRKLSVESDLLSNCDCHRSYFLNDSAWAQRDGGCARRTLMGTAPCAVGR